MSQLNLIFCLAQDGEQEVGMWRTSTTLVAFAVLVPAGCHQNTPEDLPGYEVVIPPEVPERLVVQNKDGTRTEVNGRERYAWAHREGWADFWRRYRRGELDPNDKTAEAIAMGEPREAANTRRDGFEACRKMVLRSQR
jgi:hypothetical protein